MQDNPYSAMLGVFRSDNAEHSVSPWRLGKVLSTEPLVIEVSGQQLTGADLLVNLQLLEHEEEETLTDLTGALDGSTDCGACSGSSFGATGGSLQSTTRRAGVLEPGDQVALLQSGDGQQYIVLCKVVSP